MSDPDLYAWMALRRVTDGYLAKMAGAYFDRGRPVPEYLTEVFDQLIWTGLVAVAEGDTLWDLRRLSLTGTGKARYAVLSEQRNPKQAVPPPQFGITQTPVGRRSSPTPLAPGDRPVPTTSCDRTFDLLGEAL
ncbi:MAG: hypothetical protein ACRDTC_09480 [Pseudonocardiaceae bacterium]